MKTTITTLAAVAAVTLSGCSGTMGALCYIPADSTGQCTAATVKEPIRTEPVLPAVKS